MFCVVTKNKNCHLSSKCKFNELICVVGHYFQWLYLIVLFIRNDVAQMWLSIENNNILSLDLNWDVWRNVQCFFVFIVQFELLLRKWMFVSLFFHDSKLISVCLHIFVCVCFLVCFIRVFFCFELITRGRYNRHFAIVYLSICIG